MPSGLEVWGFGQGEGESRRRKEEKDVTHIPSSVSLPAESPLAAGSSTDTASSPHSFRQVSSPGCCTLRISLCPAHASVNRSFIKFSSDYPVSVSSVSCSYSPTEKLIPGAAPDQVLGSYQLYTQGVQEKPSCGRGNAPRQRMACGDSSSQIIFGDSRDQCIGKVGRWETK